MFITGVSRPRPVPADERGAARRHQLRQVQLPALSVRRRAARLHAQEQPHGGNVQTRKYKMDLLCLVPCDVI